MKYSRLIILLVLAPLVGLAQSPVQWTFSTEKIKSNQYRVHLTAKIQPGYHIFSMTQPEDAIVLPTKINFNNATDVDEIGALREEGTLEKVRDESLEIESWQFSDKVNFSGLITLKNAKSKTTLTGQVEFQVCGTDRCYPPAKVNFSLPLNH
jgi:thiol:disulfide interchange protein DsbD